MPIFRSIFMRFRLKFTLNFPFSPSFLTKKIRKFYFIITEFPVKNCDNSAFLNILNEEKLIKVD